jgi:hypothetical protein
VRLKIESQKDSDDLVARFDDLATIDFDKSFDAYKLNRIGSPVSLWSKAGEIDYSINGLPFPEVSVEIPIGLFAASKGKYKISAAEVIGLEKYNLSIVDLETHITREIKEDDGFEFNLAGGVVENRFILKLTDNTKIDPAILNKKFNIYSAFGTLNITSLTDEFDKEKGIVSVYDLTGKKINQQSEVDWGAKYDQKQIPIKAKTSGIYIIEIKIRNRKYIEKVNIIF